MLQTPCVKISGKPVTRKSQYRKWLRSYENSISVWEVCECGRPINGGSFKDTIQTWLPFALFFSRALGLNPTTY